MRAEKKFQEVFETKEPEEVKNIFIGTKSKSFDEGTLSIIFKNPLINEQESHFHAYIVARYLRSKVTGCASITLETPNSFAFALGYFLEDYKCLALVHKGRVVHCVGGELKEKLYLLNAFSLSMIPYKRAFVEVEKVTTQEAIDLLKDNPWESYISHEATAKVLSQFLGTEVRMRREKLKLKPGDRALVFQIEVRPKEGQVFSEEEIKQIITKELFSFRLVRLL